MLSQNNILRSRWYGNGGVQSLQFGRSHCKSSRTRLPFSMEFRASPTTVGVPPPPQTASSGESGTVRKLVLLRHADSETPSNVRDHDRPISSRGKKQAADIAAQLLKKGWIPDLVLASNARRTKQTLDEMGTIMGALEDVDAHFYGSLYTVAALDGQTRQHLQECLIEVIDDQRNFCIMCVGHNKGWEEAASSFAGQTVKLRTASAALLQCVAGSWKDVLHEDAGSVWQLVDVLTPVV